MTLLAPKRTSLWPRRYPFIALDTCVTLYNSAKPENREAVRAALPCKACPENTNCLTAKEKEMSSLLFDREYRTLPRASSSSLFPFERIEPLLDTELVCVDHYRKPFGMSERYAVVSGWDIAWSERTGGDYLAKVTGVLDRVTLQKKILDIQRWRGLTFLQQIDLMRAEHSRYGDDVVVLEDEGAQRIWIQILGNAGTTDIPGLNPLMAPHSDAMTLMDVSGVPVAAHSMGKKQSFEAGVPAMLLDIEAGRWKIPYMRGRNFDVIQAFLAELEAFGWKDDKLEGVGEHDDLVDAWYHCWWGLERLRVPPSPNRKKRPPQRGKEI